MAKQAVGPVVRHVEKGVLAVTAGILLFFAATYGVVSPNKVEVGEEKVGPTELDQRVEMAANGLVEKLRGYQPQPLEVPNPGEALRKEANPLDFAGVQPELFRWVSFGLPAPKGDGPSDLPKAALVQVVRLGKPKVVFGRSGVAPVTPTPLSDKSGSGGTGGGFGSPPPPSGPPAGGGFGGGGGTGAAVPAGTYQDLNWATVSAVFDQQEQEKLTRQAGYADTRVETIFLGVNLQRRMLQPDGTYSEWADVNTFSPRSRLEYPAIEITESDGQAVIGTEVKEQIERVFEVVKVGENQLDLLRPLFAPVGYGKVWAAKEMVDGKDTGGLDARALDAWRQPSAQCRYPDCAAAEAGPAPTTFSDFDSCGKAIEEALTAKNAARARQLLDQAKTLVSGGAGGPPAGGAPPGGPGTTPGSAAETERRQKSIDGWEKSVKALEAIQGTQTVQKPTERPAKEVLWAHDATPAGQGGLLSGRTYQFRMQPRIYHRYCGLPSLLTDPKAAAIIELTGPWSDPSDPVTIDEDTVFFTRSFRPQKKQIKVEIFKWVQGDWYANTFDVGVGEAIGAQRRTNTKANPKGEQIDFGTGAVVVDVDARRAFRPKKKNRFQNPGETQALVYVDASGQLRERLVDIDKDDPGYKALKDKVYEPPKGQ